MANYLKYLLIALSVSVLAACDNKTEKTKKPAPQVQSEQSPSMNEEPKSAIKEEPKSAVEQPETAVPLPTNEAKLSAEKSVKSGLTAKNRRIAVIDGKVTLEIPPNFTERDKMAGFELMKMYSDDSGQYTLLIVTSPAVGDVNALKEQLKKMQASLKVEDNDVQMIKQDSVKAGDLEMQQLAIAMTISGKNTYSYTALGVVGDKQLNLQFTAPETERVKLQKIIDNVLASIKVK